RTTFNSSSVTRRGHSRNPTCIRSRWSALPRADPDSRSVERRMHRLREDLGEAYSLASDYWRSPERWSASALLGAIVVLNVAVVGTTLLFTYWQGAFYNALEAKDW